MQDGQCDGLSPARFRSLVYRALALGADRRVSSQKTVCPGRRPRDDFGVVLAATLTLLGLIIGFSFSMAVNRYDQRKNYEEAEANAIGTEYVRADLLPQRMHQYARPAEGVIIEQRILFYGTRDRSTACDRSNRRWTTAVAERAVVRSAGAGGRPTDARCRSRRNGHERCVEFAGIHSGGLVEPHPDCGMGSDAAIAICSNLLVGYGARSSRTRRPLLLVLPLVVSISFFLIADIDSPRGGVIHANPQNLMSLSGSLRAQ